LWNSIKSSRDAADFQKYLSRYPNGQYVEPARQRVLALEEQKAKEQEQRHRKPRPGSKKTRKGRVHHRRSADVLVPGARCGRAGKASELIAEPDPEAGDFLGNRIPGYLSAEIVFVLLVAQVRGDSQCL